MRDKVDKRDDIESDEVRECVKLRECLRKKERVFSVEVSACVGRGQEGVGFDR